MSVNIVQKVKGLNLPLGEYVVCGSGPLAAHGIREARDIDLLVTPKLYENLKGMGWQETTHAGGKKSLLKGDAEAVLSIDLGDYKVDVGKSIEEAEVIDGVPFLELSEVLQWKKARGKEKDLQDIPLIEDYLESQTE